MFLDPFPIGLYLKGKSLGKANFEVFAYKKKSHGRRRVEREIKKLVCVTNQELYESNLPDEIAVKVLAKDRRSLEEALKDKHLKREFEVNKLTCEEDHPNIVKAYGKCEIDGAPCLVMEKCETTLSEYLRDPDKCPQGKVGDGDCRKILGQIASGLVFLHNKGVIHRDLKPSNVLLRDSSTLELAISDFGLARKTSEDESVLTAPTVGVGTANYMSPEVMDHGSAPHGYPIDIWALGKIGYKIWMGSSIPNRDLTGERLFSEILTANNIKNRQLLNFLKRCMAWAPEDRIRREEILEHNYLQNLRPDRASEAEDEGDYPLEEESTFVEQKGFQRASIFTQMHHDPRIIYEMNNPRKGRVLVFSQSSQRPGNNVDVSNLKAIFRTKLGSSFTDHHDLTGKQILEQLREEEDSARSGQHDFDYLLVFVMALGDFREGDGHGIRVKPETDDPDSAYFPIKHFIDFVIAGNNRLPKFSGKPRVLVMQAGMGMENRQHITTKTIGNMTEGSDFAIFIADSSRHPEFGTQLIHDLCDEVDRDPCRDFGMVVANVHQEISKIHLADGTNKHKPPYLCNKLKKRFILRQKSGP